MGKFETDDGDIVTYKDDKKTKDLAFKKILEFCKKYECFSGESLLQSDEPQIFAPEFLADIIDDVIKFEYE